eukprot:5094991-Amphidinium_carterae.5
MALDGSSCPPPFGGPPTPTGMILIKLYLRYHCCLDILRAIHRLKLRDEQIELHASVFGAIAQKCDATMLQAWMNPFAPTVSKSFCTTALFSSTIQAWKYFSRDGSTPLQFV